MSAAYLIEISV